jgi:hypothetical protein
MGTSPLAAKVKAAKEPKPEVTEPAEAALAEKPAKAKKPKRQKKPKGEAPAPAAAPGAPQPAPKPSVEKFRFPHNTTLTAVYDGEAKLWTVAVTANGQTQSVTKSGIHHAIHTLGRMWFEAQKLADGAPEPAS